MKRFFVTLILVLLVVWAVRSSHPRPVFQAPPPGWPGPRHPHDGVAGRQLAEARRQAQRELAEAGRVLDDVRHEVQKAYREARQEIRHAWSEASDEIRQAYHDALASEGGPRPPMSPPPPSPPVLAREDAEGIPVPIVPGTRVTRAEARPPAPPARLISRTPTQAPRKPAHRPAPVPATPTTTIVEGQICATEKRAMADADRAFQRKVIEWLHPDVPSSWTPPAPLVQALVLERRSRPVVSPTLDHSPTLKEDSSLYVAELKVDLSPGRRDMLVETYTRELVQHRLVTLGGALAFVLICLGVISGYIRADEATKGYYTNRLRMLAAAGVGAAGVILYNMVA